MDTQTLTIKIAADIAELQSKMRQAEQLVGSTVGNITQNFKSMAMALGAGISIAGLSAFVKGAIDAADEASKLAQKVGVATKDVAGLQLAFQQSGAGDAFAGSMAKMSKSIADGSKAFDAMGISTKNNDGTLKSTRVLLGEVSTKFAGYEDGVQKIALAQEIFGKAGADLIPLLNAGGQALDDYDAMAKKLGLTISDDTAKQAEKFNDTMDLVSQGTQGVARQIAAQLLPTLTGLADQFFTSTTSGDKLKNTADFLASSMKILYVSGLGVVEIFTTVGKTLGGVSAAVVAALSGDFTGATHILKDLKSDLGTGWKDTLTQMQAAWNATGSAAVESMAATQKAAREAAPMVGDLAKQTKAAAEAAKALAKEHEERIKIGRKLAIQMGDDVTKANDAYQKSLEEATKENDKYIDSLDKSAAAVAAQVQKLQDEEQALSISQDQHITLAQAIEQVEIARLREQQAIEMSYGDEKAVAAIQREIEQRKLLATAIDTKTVRESATKATDELTKANKKAAEESSKFWTDALMRGFENGKGFFENMWDTIRNKLKTDVLKVFIQPIAAGISGLVGFGGAANAADSATGSVAGSFAQSTLGNITIAGSSIAAIGSSVMAGVQAGYAGTSIAGAASAYSAAGMTGVSTGLTAGSAIGSSAAAIQATLAAIPGWGWAAMAALAAVAIFNNKQWETKYGGSFDNSGSGGSVNKLYGPGTGGEFANQFAQTALKATENSINAVFAKIGSASRVGYFSAGAESSKEGEAYAYAGGRLATGQAFGQVGSEFNRGNASAEEAVKNLVRELQQSTLQALQAATDIPKSISDKLTGINIDALVGESLDKLTTGLDHFINTIVGVQTDLAALPFGNIKALSFDAAAGLVAFSGGLDQFKTNLASYYDNFYSLEEKRTQTLKSIATALNAAGSEITAEQVGAATREQFRAAAEGLDVTTESGQRLYAAMLSVNGAFASITPAATTATASVEKISAAMQSLDRDTAALQIELLAAQGNTQGAGAALKALETQGFSAVEVAVYDLNAGLRATISTLNAATEAAEREAQTRTTWQQRLDVLTGKTTERQLALQADLASTTDATTQSLIKQVYAQQDLSAATETATAAAKVAADARLSTVTTAASDAVSGLQRAVAAQKTQDLAEYNASKIAATAIYTAQVTSLQASMDGVKTSLDAVGTSVGKLKSLSSTLKSTLDGMRIAGSEAAYRSAAQAQLKAALATARSGGGLPLDGQLGSALQTLSKPSEALYATFEDYARDFYTTANDISALSDLTESQLSADQITQGILEGQSKALQDQKSVLKDGFADQVSSLDAILSTAQAQLDVANGINTSVLTVAQAMGVVNSTLAALQGERATQGLATTPGVAESRAATIREYMQGLQANTALSDTEKAVVLAQRASIEGVSESEIASAWGSSKAETRAYFAAAGIPQFASGINRVPYDMTARIHADEAVIPAAFNPFNPNAARSNGANRMEGNTARLEALIQTLIEKVAVLEDPTKASATANKKLASQFDSATRGGRAMQNEAYV
jgi:hypothetical protein